MNESLAEQVYRDLLGDVLELKIPVRRDKEKDRIIDPLRMRLQIERSKLEKLFEMKKHGYFHIELNHAETALCYRGGSDACLSNIRRKIRPARRAKQHVAPNYVAGDLGGLAAAKLLGGRFEPRTEKEFVVRDALIFGTIKTRSTFNPSGEMPIYTTDKDDCLTFNMHCNEPDRNTGVCTVVMIGCIAPILAMLPSNLQMKTRGRNDYWVGLHTPGFIHFDSQDSLFQGVA